MSNALAWLKSSYSIGEGECLEVALTWAKSSYCSEQGGECLEVAPCPTPGEAATIHIRDSKNPSGPTLHIARATWTAFLSTHSPSGSRR
ncbi:DUF397 domain-containing protein [Streptomyces aureoverticillatus]|uniref:DUF397 domain-containing protein n=1 Tax=Streptomyces aureoverticillatus TaxID=66871 RepID=UPI0013DD1FEB|nr:DUF397 domain-containing protein [Streptomyces aureoverticillatus]QIB48979.1 DUF397 domain-containing protein [Streptomyces aureoverticillatus]